MTLPNKTVNFRQMYGNDEEALREYMIQGLNGNFFNALKKFRKRHLEKIINKKYTVGDHEEMTLLIEGSLHGHYKIVKYLLDKFNVNVNDTGTVKHFGTLIEGATALWCAAGSGNLEIVKLLIEKGAIVNYYTTTNSTPLRAACYLGQLDVVKYLCRHGADINLYDIHKSTCLMIASYKGYKYIVKYLIRRGVDVNNQNNTGSTALHFAAQSNNHKIVKLLYTFNAKHLKNNLSMTPIMIAANQKHTDIVQFIIDKFNLNKEEEIEALELLAASNLNDKNNYNSIIGLNLLTQAMGLRYDNYPITPKILGKTVEAFDNRVEFQTMENLMSKRDDDEALHYESLLIRHRILGENNPDFMEAVVYRGAVCADLNDYTSCIKLWNYAMKMTQNNNLSVYDDIHRFTQVFCQMIEDNVMINISDLKNVLEVTLDELKTNQLMLSTVTSPVEKKGIQDKYFRNILSALGLIVITSISFGPDSMTPNLQKGELYLIIVEIIRINPRTKDNQSLLHLCLNYETNVDNMFTTGVCRFPNFNCMKLLIYCGADVNALDNNLNTTIHCICKFIRNYSKFHFLNDTNIMVAKNVIIELINKGVHTDYVNTHGVCPYTDCFKSIFNLYEIAPRSLKCLSAKALKKNVSKKYYQDELPKVLLEFTNLH